MEPSDTVVSDNKYDDDDGDDDDDDPSYDVEDIDYETDQSVVNIESSEDDQKCKEKKTTSRKELKLKDDGNTAYYKDRIKQYYHEKAKQRISNIDCDNVESKDLNETTTIEGPLKIPTIVWQELFDHQKIGVKWLWELDQLGTGGILGDEMGLGKTIQTISFLIALKESDQFDRHTNYVGLGPTLLICPATVMHQWLVEFRRWWPPFRVAILHSTGTFAGKKKSLVETIHKSNGILIVSFPGAVIYQDIINNYRWHYAILDEGHKIRNPDAQVTLTCKRIRTPHRIILSGSPIQNNLKELWSVFDFIYPGKLGTLPVFMEQFAIPINQGGYANASDTQVQIAYKCACVLRDTIKPYLLRRSKLEINNNLKLPDKSEQVLFCKLTEKQRALYMSYLNSRTIRDIRKGLCQIFVGLIELRKICNHPDLFDSTDCVPIRTGKDDLSIERKKFLQDETNETKGDYRKSGKMLVVDVLLKLWHKQGHKVLLFTQSRQMLKFLLVYLREKGYNHLFMDGQTQIGSRQTLIDQFNNDETIFIFVLTTRVGGVGTNLVGANRVLIYDPDWNPSTDIQARERAWRIGQKRDVIIYRLITAGTIEEKIYHRQIFKLYLTNRILRNTKQKRFFKTNDLHELFTLGDSDKNIETKALFEEDLQIKPEDLEKNRASKKRKHINKKSESEQKSKISFDSNTSQCSIDSLSHRLSNEAKEAMRQRAKALSKMLEQKFAKEIEEKKLEGSYKDDTTCTIIDNQVPSTSSSKTCLLVDHLVRQSAYNETQNAADLESSNEDYVLKRLFKKSNIAGAFKHDKIETDPTHDYKIVEKEAEKIARDAIRSLRESRRLCMNSMSGVPNWTGRNGSIFQSRTQSSSQRQPTIKRGRGFLGVSSNNSSSSMLNAIKQRTNLNPCSTSRQNNDEDEEDVDQRVSREFEGIAQGTGAGSMAGQLQTYLMHESSSTNESKTEELLDFFKQRFEPSKTAVFKAILYKMCNFERRPTGGFWILKHEFRI